MNIADPPKTPENLESFSQTVGATSKSNPSKLFLLDNNIPFHASRLMLLIKMAGRPTRKPSIEGRTKLAKLDFFVRYPVFLLKAINIKGSSKLLKRFQNITETNIESYMPRYKYGPWDHKYYLVLAYLVGKNLIDVIVKNNIDNYQLTNTGLTVVEQLFQQKGWEIIVQKCEIVGDLFEGNSGTDIKNFIYKHFPEVVHTPHSQLIVPKDNNKIND